MDQESGRPSESQATSQESETGMLGTQGTTPKEEIGRTGNTAPVGVPTEPGPPDVAGTPALAPLGGQLTGHNVPGSSSPQTSEAADEGLGYMPTPGGM